MAEFSITVFIADDDRHTLLSNNYRLCFAESFNGSYTAVWQSYESFFQNSTFSWKNEYGIFIAPNFIEGAQMGFCNNPAAIALGQIITLDSFGSFGSASSGGRANAINLINQYGLIYPAVCQTCSGIDGSYRSNPAFVMPSVAIKGSAEFIPDYKLLVWFDQGVSAGTMIKRAALKVNARSNFMEVDFSDKSQLSVKYANQTWSF
jgi:hypothetical protein